MDFEDRIQEIFNPLKLASSALPKPGEMKDKLNNLIPPKGTSPEVPVNKGIIKLFASASVEMWLRSVHSFLISSSLTNVSPLWSAIAGYYSSHYTVRAIAHLLGIYQLRTKQYAISLQTSSSGFTCYFKNKKSREHSFYWEIVKNDRKFLNDELFTDNNENDGISDASHRNFATYIDHLDNFPNFNPLTLNELKNRIEFISKMKIYTYEIPDKNKYPDIEAVQILAYHRLVYYRELIDEIVGTKNNFWNVHRDPNWCRNLISFQRLRPSLSETLGI